MHPQGAGDGADAPVLGVEEPANLRAQLGRDHGQRASGAQGAGPRGQMGEGRVPHEVARSATARAANGGGAGSRQIGLVMMRVLLVTARRGLRTGRRREHHAGADGAGGSLLRHFLFVGALAGPIPCLPGRMPQPPRAPVLIAAAALAYGRTARPPGARRRAVAIAPIAVPTEKEHAPAIAARTDHEPEGIHAPPRPGHGGGQSRAGVRRQGAESRAPVCDLARGPGVLPTPGSHPCAAVSGSDLPQLDQLGNRWDLRSRLGRISTSSDDQRHLCVISCQGSSGPAAPSSIRSSSTYGPTRPGRTSCASSTIS